MKTSEKMTAIPVLMAAAHCGIVVRGFQGLAHYRGSGSGVQARSITFEGQKCDVTVKAHNDWLSIKMSSDDQSIAWNLKLEVSDSGQVRFTEWIEEAPEDLNEEMWH